MRNIEIKALIKDVKICEDTAERITNKNADFNLNQVDTYFKVNKGRFKLREINNEESQLIYYRRPDEEGPKKCIYDIVDVNNPEAVKNILDKVLGIDVEVRKNRKVYLYENVRIHIDTVDELGDFIEFEAVMADDMTDKEGQELLNKLMLEFDIKNEDLIKDSYCDILRNKQN